MTKRLAWMAIGLAVLAVDLARAGAAQIEITVAAGDYDRRNTPVRAILEGEALPLLSPQVERQTALLTGADGKPIVAQITPLRIIEPGGAASTAPQLELHFVLPELAAGKSATYALSFRDESPTAAFAWKDNEGKYADLVYGDRPVLRYMYERFDDSTKERREETYKVFHHLFSPDGKRLVTKGSGGQYPHHRGLFYGFNKVSYAGVPRCDLWHCQGDDHQRHAGQVVAFGGPVVARQCILVEWHGARKQTILTERRELTAYGVAGGTLVEFASRLESAVGALVLDGDPQHAGFHFRADDEVAKKTNKETYYVRPDGVGKPGETRNWPADKTQVNFPWKGMSFVIDGQRYTAAILDRPDNPKEARFSERDYGRFGSYFEYDLGEGKTLTVNYRVWLQDGEMKPEQIAAFDNDFVSPPSVTVAVK